MNNPKEDKFIHRFIGLKLISIVLLLVTTINEVSYSQELAFPGAEGFGKYSKGGRGGKVIEVVNLEDSGPGSLREALESDGVRYIVFNVDGIIDLENRIKISNPYVTIAGQTAPGDGIVLRGNGISVETHNVIIRFLRIRPGDVDFGTPNNWSGIDALSIGSSDSSNLAENIMIDHCSFSWAIDENIGLWNGGKNITIQNSIISEALAMSKHPKGDHSKGMLVGGTFDNVSILNNYFAHNHARNPRLSNEGFVEVRNNIIFNPRGFGIKISNSKIKKTQHLNIVGNYFFKGRSTKFSNGISIWSPEEYNGKIYLSGNKGFYGSEDWDIVDKWQTREAVNNYDHIELKSPFRDLENPLPDIEDLFNDLENTIGASLPSRDQVDKRVVSDFFKFEGSVINSQYEVGGWGEYKSGSPFSDSNTNGLPDSFEMRYGIGSEDLNEDFDNDGYVNFEEFLNGTNPLNSKNSKDEIFSSFSKNGLNKEEEESYDRNGIILLQNFPNPFRDSTTLPVILFEKQIVSVKIYNSLGHLVHSENYNELPIGLSELVWRSGNLASGLYIVYVKADRDYEIKKMIHIDNQ